MGARFRRHVGGSVHERLPSLQGSRQGSREDDIEVGDLASAGRRHLSARTAKMLQEWLPTYESIDTQ